MSELGMRIKNERIKRGLTMEELGTLIGTSKGTVNNWEKGRNDPDRKNLKLLADQFDLSTIELKYGIDTAEKWEKFDSEVDLGKLKTEVSSHQYFDGDIGKQMMFLMNTLRIEEATLTFEGEELDADTQSELLKSLESTYTMIKRILK